MLTRRRKTRPTRESGTIPASVPWSHSASAPLEASLSPSQSAGRLPPHGAATGGGGEYRLTACPSSHSLITICMYLVRVSSLHIALGNSMCTAAMVVMHIINTQGVCGAGYRSSRSDRLGFSSPHHLNKIWTPWARSEAEKWENSCIRSGGGR